MNATKTIIARLYKIETQLKRHYRIYEHSARHSNSNLISLTAISNLESERHMLEAALANLKRAS